MFDLKKILVPVDFSERSAAAASYAKAFGQKFQAELLLLHVEHAPRFMGSVAGRAHRSAAVQEVPEVEGKLEEFARAEFQDLSVSHEVREGDAAAKIIEYARQTRADLIMMPTRGCGPYRRLLRDREGTA